MYAIRSYYALTKANAVDLMENAISFEKYTQPVKDFITSVVEGDDNCYFVTPSHPRISYNFV